MNEYEEGHYDSTISTSQEESISEAIKIAMADIKKNQIEQEIIRPDVSLVKFIRNVSVFWGCFIVTVAMVIKKTEKKSFSRMILFVFISLMFFVTSAICLKNFIIRLILLYQKYAPEKVRKLCCFEPSCSEYMKLAVEKYGVIKGVYKGCKRLCRCHWPNGGVDYP